MNYPYVYAIPEICYQLGIRDAIIAPGSRSAPLTIAFARHQQISCKVIPDERSAGFIALGLAQSSATPVVLICTSGSAALNFYPAIAEAYFQQVPLLVLTADRPPEWIDQLDGQTIRQTDVYGKHIKKSFNWAVDQNSEDAQWYSQRIISEAINLANEFPSGPCHINVPFREPLYPTANNLENFNFKVIKQDAANTALHESQVEAIEEELTKFNRVLIICGQDFRQSEELTYLRKISERARIPIVGDIISNIQKVDSAILHSDIFLGSSKKGLAKSLQPDLLITIGKSILSKNLKMMLRENSPQEHWHIQTGGAVADTYKSLTKVIRATASSFLKIVSKLKSKDDFNYQKQENYYQIWQIEERRAKRTIADFFPQKGMGEFEVIQKTLSQFETGNLHLANSMAVRYANFIGLTSSQSDVRVYSNRGTSGIDGSNSTAQGVALHDKKKLNLLITGDMAFFYDRNAFWHNYQTPNLRILVLNNHAGGIFRIIKGPASTPELEDYFETKQALTAKYAAEEFGFEYLLCDRKSKLKNYIKNFIEDDGQAKIMEVETSSEENKEILEQFKAAFEQQN